jgi:hypothetical protein
MKLSQTLRTALNSAIPPELEKPADEAKMKTCFPCHKPFQGGDSVFTRYAP